MLKQRFIKTYRDIIKITSKIIKKSLQKDVNTIKIGLNSV